MSRGINFPEIFNSMASSGSGGGVSDEKYVRTTRFVSIGAGASGTVTLPALSTVVLDDFGGTTDAVVSTITGGKPDYAHAVTAGGAIIATTFDASGNYTFSGTPSAYPVAIIYRVRQLMADFDSTATDIIGDAIFDSDVTKLNKTGDTMTGKLVLAVVDLADAATIVVDASLGNTFRVTLGGNRTLGNPANPTNGQLIMFEIKQDATGNRTLAFDTKYRFGNSLFAALVSSTANKIDYIGAKYNSTDDKWDIIAFSDGY